MGRPTPETGGGSPHNQGLSEFKPLATKREVGWGVKKREEPKQQPADPNREAFERFFRSGPMRPAVLEGLPPRQRRDNTQLPEKLGEQRGKPGQPQPNPAEQQAAERLGKPPPEEAANKLDSSPQEQDEPQVGEQEEVDEFDFQVRVFPSATWVGPFSRKSSKKPERD